MIPYLNIKIPNDYLHELMQQNKNKLHAFMEWLLVNEQIEFGQLEEMHSIRFFAQSWGQWERQECIKPKSTKTVRNWMKEFEEVMEKFDAGWAMRRWQRSARARNSSVKKQSTRQSHTEYPPKEAIKPTVSDSKKTEYPPSTHRVPKINNIYDDDNAEFLIKKEFENLFFVFKAHNAKYAGKKDEAYQAYREWRAEGNTLSIEELRQAISFYMSDKEIEKKNGFKSFIKNELYFEYIDKNIRLELNGKWIDGRWSYVDEIFYDSSNEPVGVVNRSRFKSMLGEGRIVLEVA